MPEIHPAPSARARPSLRAFGAHVVRLVLLLGAALLGLTACSASGLDSPEAVFRRVQELNASGEIAKIWDLYTEDERRRQSEAYQSYKEFLRTNPLPINRQKCIENFRVEPEELMTMTAPEIYVQQVSEPSRRRWLEGARILGSEPAPDLENGMRVRWETAQGERSTMLVQFVEDGWFLVTLRE